MDPQFLELDDILDIHNRQIERYGGTNGIRDRAGLESAIATPQATFGGDYLHRRFLLWRPRTCSTFVRIIRF